MRPFQPNPGRISWIVQRPFMGGGQHDRGRDAVGQRLRPAHRDHTPAVTRDKTGKPVLGSRSAQVVADPPLMVEEFGRHHRTDHMPSDVLRSGGASAVPEKPGNRIDPAGFEWAAQDVEFLGHQERISRGNCGEQCHRIDRWADGDGTRTKIQSKHSSVRLDWLRP